MVNQSQFLFLTFVFYSFFLFRTNSIETVTIWSAIKIMLVVIAGLYLIVAGITWDKRALAALTLCLGMWLLSACNINTGATASDAQIAQSAANSQAQAAASQAAAQQAQLAAEQQAHQLNALAIAQANAVQAHSEAQAQLAAQNGLAANADALQAGVLNNAVIALDAANARASQRSDWLAWLLVLIVAGGLGVAGMAVYWRGRVAVATVRPALPQLTDAQILHAARAMGYLVERNDAGWIVKDPRNNQLVSKTRLLLEATK